MSNSSLTYRVQVNSLKKGSHCLLKSHPCNVTEIIYSKTGKHGYPKSHIIGNDIFTDKKYEEIMLSMASIEVPFITHKEYDLNDVREDGYLTLYDIESKTTREDLALPKGTLGKEIRIAFEKGSQVQLSVLSAMGTEQVMRFKVLQLE
jgi:translation initiation factor 5A